MGAGPDLAGWDSPHPFVIDNLFTQGLINSRVFSLDLRSIESDRGKTPNQQCPILSFGN